MSFAMRGLPIYVFVAVLTLAGQALGQFESCAKWVPESANLMLMVRAKDIYDSELAKKEGWKKDQIKAFESGAAFLPATTERLLIAAQMDLDTMDLAWKVGVYEKYGPEISIAKVSEKTGGNIDTLNGLNAVVLPNDTYFIEADADTLISMAPASRQATMRWLKSKVSPAITLSPYLNQALKFIDANADVVFALDLEHVLDETKTAERLKMLGFANDNALPTVADALSKIQGLMLGITVNEQITGALRMDFDASPSVLKTYAKPILIEVLSRRGVMLDDINNWNVSTSGNSIVLSGPMTEPSFRKVLSLVRQSIQHDVIAQGAAGDQNADQQETPATISKQYFAKLMSIVNELSTIREDRALNTYATYFERYAAEIDGWSILNVDEDLAKFGTYVSDNLRNAAGVLRDAQFTKSNQQASLNSNRYGTFGYGGYGYGFSWTQGAGLNYNNQRRAIGTQQNNAGEEEARNIMRNVGKQLSELRRALTQKYQIEF